LFLRLFCPAFLSPRQFDLVREHPDSRTHRTLTLLAKLIQSLGNLSEFGVKEAYMTPMNKFIRENTKGLMEFLDQVVVARPNPQNLHAGGRAPTATLQIPESQFFDPFDPPAMKLHSGYMFSPPVSPYMIDRDRELTQFVTYVMMNKEKILLMHMDANRRISKGDALEKLLAICEDVHSKVTSGRREGFDGGASKKPPSS